MHPGRSATVREREGASIEGLFGSLSYGIKYLAYEGHESSNRNVQAAISDAIINTYLEQAFGRPTVLTETVLRLLSTGVLPVLALADGSRIPIVDVPLVRINRDEKYEIGSDDLPATLIHRTGIPVTWVIESLKRRGGSTSIADELHENSAPQFSVPTRDKECVTRWWARRAWHHRGQKGHLENWTLAEKLVDHTGMRVLRLPAP